MTVETIIKKVRWCIDDETHYQDFEDNYMDNIIKSHLTDALRWCCLYGEGSHLAGSDTVGKDPGTVKSITWTVGTSLPEWLEDYVDGVLTLPADFVKLVRVRCEGWHKAVMTPIEEDSEDYLMLSDETAKATKDRPQAAIIEAFPQRLELHPAPKVGEDVELTIIVNPEGDASGTVVEDETDFAIPPRVSTAFIYYLAFLVLSAYNDTAKAQSMLGIAKMHLGMQKEN